jgi:type III secretion protein R
MTPQIDPMSLAFLLALLALVPILVVITTSFVKISVVLQLVRNALGVQQIPPNMALYGLAAILSFYIMAPAAQNMYAVVRGAEPLRGFMLKHSRPQLRQFFMNTAKELWDEKLLKGLKEDHFLILMPSFMVSELTSAFEIGFLLYLPFIVIDLIVSNILLAMGMMMVSPVTISLPLKLFLFVMVDGWGRLIRGLVMTYV